MIKNYPSDAKAIALAVAINEKWIKKESHIVEGQDVDFYSGQTTVIVEGDIYHCIGLGEENWTVEGKEKVIVRDTPFRWFDTVRQREVR